MGNPEVERRNKRGPTAREHHIANQSISAISAGVGSGADGVGLEAVPEFKLGCPRRSAIIY
jgi:hypothetical protein